MEALSKFSSTLLLLAVFCLSGCTEEKAKALQLTAESFKNEADIACAFGADSIKASVAMPARTRGDISKSLTGAKKFGAGELETIYSDASMVDGGMKPAQDALTKACEAHRQLAAIYTDLPRGYLLATDDVKRAQKYVVNVTARFAKLAHVFESLPNIGKDNVARIKIIEAHAKAIVVTDEKARSSLMDSIAEDILSNQENETQNRARVMTQFAKAVALGEKLAHASLDYDKLSVADLLESLREFSTIYGSITGRTAVAQNAIERISNVEARIKNDPVLSPLLDAELVR
jgi:hypothetical protein